MLLVVAPTILHVAPHPDDEAVGCPGALLHLKDRGWNVVSLVASLGYAGQWDRRRAEAEDAAARAGFVPVFLDPPAQPRPRRGPGAGHPPRRHRAAEHRRGARGLHRRVALPPRCASRPRGRRPGRAAGHGCSPPSVRWWMWGVWGDLPAPNVYYGFDADRAGPGAAHPRRLRRRARAQRLPALPDRSGRLQRGHGVRARLRLRLPRRQHPPLRRPRDRGAPRRRPLHGVRAAPSRPGPRAVRVVRRRPDALARLADRARNGGLHPRGPGHRRRRRDDVG